MIRKAFVMHVFGDCHEEYQRRHDEIWPEMVEMLKEYGAHDYSIFLDPTSNRLFAYLVIEDEERWSKTAETEICQKWWAYMKDVMETNEDHSPVSLELKEVFYLK
ncbi:L-rhamnose mutarotase [Brevibacillus choshinensis]|uniref:L-rhamnose mutarotase n=1 Tax=Brevibacillus choshinensis TaxID=54911 RepID=A0ABX7FLP8_BRECH|nr:L-rhamnose mutarotase [Brevibacillus choshinensis]QRG67168.1 L-rhamnose mutarotase [Brevibacillus choshinensis]